MRKTIAVLLALLLALPAFGAFAEGGGTNTISCPEEGFTTQADFDCVTTWVEGEGLYIYLDQEGYYPYILVGADFADDRVTDGFAHLEDTIYPLLQQTYGQNGGTSMNRYGSYTLAGRDVAAAEFQFKTSNGVRNRLLFIIDVRDDCSIYYRCRYTTDESAQRINAALDTLAANLRIGTEPAATAGGTTVISCPDRAA